MELLLSALYSNSVVREGGFSVHIKLHLLALLQENDKPLLDSKLKVLQD